MKNFQNYLDETGEFGFVEAITSPLFYVSGLPKVKPQEVVITENGSRGIVQVLLKDLVEVLMLDSMRLTHQEKVVRINQSIGMDVSEALLGRVIDPFGYTIDDLPPITQNKVYMPVDRFPPGILDRARVTEPFETGVAVVDLLVQIGKGQKELVAGDQKTGKTAFLLQTISYQAKKGIVCIYVCIGKRRSDLKWVEEFLRATGALGNSVIVAATSSDPVSHVYYAPFSGFTVAEFFRDRGKNVLIVLDDMTTHAKYYREISLVGKKTPGRGSYPGDIFHHQARLLERTGNIRKEDGTVNSITSLPVAETQEGDLTGYIQTNLMAMTDGHIYFDVQEFKRGRHPAVNHTLSVTRIGNQTQTLLEKGLRRETIKRLNDFYEIKETSSFGVEVPPEYRVKIRTGEKIEAILNQEIREVIPTALRYILIGLVLSDFFAEKNLGETIFAKKALIKAYFEGRLKKLEAEVLAAKDLKALLELLQKYKQPIFKMVYGNIQ